MAFSTTTTSFTTNNPDKPPTQYAEVSEYPGNIPVTSGVSGHEYQYIELADRTVNQTTSQVRVDPRMGVHISIYLQGIAEINR